MSGRWHERAGAFRKHAELLCDDYDSRDREVTTVTLDEERLFLAICMLDEAADIITALRSSLTGDTK